MSKDLNDYLDAYGMIVTKFDRDGGDSCAHGFAILYAGFLGYTYVPVHGIAYAAALCRNNLFIRHPDPTKWYSETDRFSRDQMIPLLVYSGIGINYAEQLYSAHLKRGLLFAWNTRMNAALPGTPGYAWKIPDLTGPDIWATWIRVFRCYILYPLLWVLDWYNLFASVLYRIGIAKSTLQMNQVLMVDFSCRVMITPISWLSKKIYGKLKPTAAIQKSWGPEWQPPVDEYLTELIKTW